MNLQLLASRLLRWTRQTQWPKSNFKLVLLALSLGIPVARAGLYVEPYLGYSVNSAEQTSSSTDFSYDSPYFGGRLGGSFMMLNLGLDYMMRPEHDVKYDAPASLAGTKEKHDGKYLGAFIGVDFPVLVRAYASYYFDATLEDKDGSDVADELNGKGYMLGLGFTGLPFVSLNLEYRALTFDEYKDASAGTTTALTGNQEYSAKEIGFSVSIPLDL